MKNLNTILVSAILITGALRIEAQTQFNQFPSRIIGQPVLQQQTLTAVAPNLVEGRELYGPQAVAVDTSSSPAIVYVADTNNNRILAWKNPAALTKGDRADKVIGQRDFLTTFPKGPGSDLNAGLSLPVTILVDKSGNLYVADGGNNRIVRYPAPFSQTSDLLSIDLIIGQHDFSGRSANEGLSAPTAKTLAYSSGGAPQRAGLAFDAQGNLWASDPLNNRVLRYPASALASGAGFEPSADLVLGQADFSSGGQPPSPTRDSKNFLTHPSGIAFDPQGRLFVADNNNRVLVYALPSNSGALALRILGVILPTQQVPNPPSINESTLGSVTNVVNPPEGIFFIGNNPFVVDRGNARILKYDPFDQWPAESTAFSPKAIAVIGQPDYVSNRSNRGQPQPSEQTFSGPVQAHNAFEAGGVVSATASGNDVYVADAGNNRVLIFPQQSAGNFSSANRVLGQLDFQYNSVNLIEGREFFFGPGGAVVVDTQSNPPHLYVSDLLNNRVLGFKDYRTVKPGDRADLVIGQPDFFTAMLNYPKNDPNQINDQGLSLPEGIAVDANGDLWVADFGNGRVLRFAKPFDQPQGTQAHANLVIGQPNFFIKVPDEGQQTMGGPYGIAFTPDGHLLVSDFRFNRVLFFRKPAGGDFVNGQAATTVFGQPDFNPHATGSLSSPGLIATDTDGRLYVADTGNNRVVIYGNANTAGNDPAPSFFLTSANTGQSISTPTGVFVSPVTGSIWVASTGAGRVFRFPRFNVLVSNSTANAVIPANGPTAVALDQFDNPVIIESSANRVAFYYQTFDLSSSAGGLPGRFSGNAANYFQRFAPRMLASIFAFSRFGDDTATFSAVPIPPQLGDISVTVAGIPAPILYASPGQINFQIPAAVPVGSAPQEIQVTRVSTGQILASALVRIDPVSPGLFTANSTGTGQLAVRNQDGITPNDGTHPAKAGSVITLYGTGEGLVSGAPPDGVPNPNMPVSTDEKPMVYINAISGPVPDEDVLYSGLAPGFVGLWQINVRIPKDAPIGDVPVTVVFKNISSRSDQSGSRNTTIRTTP
ncbi:MAG: hypothetical protein ACR2NN_16375 [Bryobacteraceae bacterium]